MAREMIDIYWDVPAARLVRAPVEGETATVATTTTPQLYLGVGYLLRIRLLNADTSAYDASAFTGDFEAFAGNPADPLVEVADSEINQGDWVDESLANGKISVRVDFTSEDLIADLSTSSSKRMYVEVRAEDGDGAVRVLCVMPVQAINVVLTPAA